MNKSFDVKIIIHTVIGLLFVFFGRYLPAPSITVPATESLLALGFPLVNNGADVIVSISAQGMTIATIFAGTMYLWTLVNVIWPCFLAIFMLGISGYVPMPLVLSTFMGQPLVVMIFFLFIFIGIIIENRLAEYLVEFIMTRKVIKGRPWLLTFYILLATFIVGQISQVASTLLMWSALYTILDKVGYKKGDSYTTVMIAYIPIVSILAFCTNPATGGGIYFLSNVQDLAQGSTGLNISAMPFVSYGLFGLVISAITLAIAMFLMRFVFRVDVSLLKNFDTNIFLENKLPPLTLKHKIIIALFFSYMLWILLPTVIGLDNPIGLFLSQTTIASTMFLVFLALVIKINGEPISELNTCVKSVPWSIYFLLATAFMLGSFTTKPETNINLYMEYFFASFLTGMEPLTLSIAIIVIAIITTNLANSVVVGLILIPILIAICNSLNLPPEPVLACYFYTTCFGALTPAASPYAAMLYGNNEWIDPPDVVKHTAIGSLTVVCVVIVVGLPLANILFAN